MGEETKLLKSIVIKVIIEKEEQDIKGGQKKKDPRIDATNNGFYN